MARRGRDRHGRERRVRARRGRDRRVGAQRGCDRQVNQVQNHEQEQQDVLGQNVWREHEGHGEHKPRSSGRTEGCERGEICSRGRSRYYRREHERQNDRQERCDCVLRHDQKYRFLLGCMNCDQGHLGPGKSSCCVFLPEIRRQCSCYHGNGCRHSCDNMLGQQPRVI